MRYGIRAQATAVVHRAVGLHPGRWTPGRGEQLDRLARHALRGLDEWQQRTAIALDAEAVEREIIGPLDMRVIAEREVARVRVNVAQRVAMTRQRVEVVVQQGLAGGFAQRLPNRSRGLGEGTAETLNDLTAPAGVDQHGR
jgi:hypothetical protein